MNTITEEQDDKGFKEFYEEQCSTYEEYLSKLNETDELLK